MSFLFDENSGTHPFDIRLFDPSAAPGLYPDEAAMYDLVQAWWKIRSVRIQATASFARDWKIVAPSGDSSEYIFAPGGSFSYDETVDVVPGTLTLAAQRVVPSYFTPAAGPAGLLCPFANTSGTTSDPNLVLQVSEIDVSGGSSTTTGPGAETFRPTFALGIMGPGFPNPLNSASLPANASPIVRSPAGLYYPAFAFLAAADDDILYGNPAAGAPGFGFNSFASTLGTNSGGDTSDPGFGLGIPGAQIGTGTFVIGGSTLSFPLYGYSGALVSGPGAPGAGGGDTWSGSDTVSASVTLTAIFDP